MFSCHQPLSSVWTWWGTTRIHGESQSLAQWDAQNKASASASTLRTVNLIPGWWFGTWLLLFHILGIKWNNHPNWHQLTNIFQRGRSTTNQWYNLRQAITTTSWLAPQLLDRSLKSPIIRRHHGVPSSVWLFWAFVSTSNVSLFGDGWVLHGLCFSSQNHRRSPWYWVVMHF